MGDSAETSGELIFRELNSSSSECRSYLVGSRSTGEAAIVDPLLGRVEHYVSALNALGLRLVVAIDTHTHADHLSGSRDLAQRLGATTAGSPEGSVARPLHEGDVVRLGGVALQVWATPGHTADSLSLLLPDRVLTGDSLLIGATGRTDLPTGDAAAEWDSVQRLLSLPDPVLVFPAHDYAGREVSSIGRERRENVRVNGTREAFLACMNKPRKEKPTLLAQSLAWNTRPL